MVPDGKAAITGIILSGGKSLRMGENKAFIPIAGVPIIRRIHSVFVGLFQEILIITNETDLYRSFEAEIRTDLIPGAGALGGLYTGLTFARFQYAFVVACDMPYLNPWVIRYMIRCKEEGYDIVVPRTRGGLEPLHALYSKDCLKPVEQCLHEGKTRILDFFHRVRVRTIEPEEILPIDPHLKSFININTPTDLAQHRS
jgi:molybdopterin-guanine dinucleotide biosynthesis protein A